MAVLRAQVQKVSHQGIRSKQPLVGEAVFLGIPLRSVLTSNTSKGGVDDIPFQRVEVPSMAKSPPKGLTNGGTWFTVVFSS